VTLRALLSTLPPAIASQAGEAILR